MEEDEDRPPLINLEIELPHWEVSRLATNSPCSSFPLLVPSFLAGSPLLPSSVYFFPFFLFFSLPSSLSPLLLLLLFSPLFFLLFLFPFHSICSPKLNPNASFLFLSPSL